MKRVQNKCLKQSHRILDNIAKIKCGCLHYFLKGKIRDLSYMRSSDVEPFDDEVAEDAALTNALALDPMKQTLASVNMKYGNREIWLFKIATRE